MKVILAGSLGTVSLHGVLLLDVYLLLLLLVVLLLILIVHLLLLLVLLLALSLLSGSLSLRFLGRRSLHNLLLLGA